MLALHDVVTPAGGVDATDGGAQEPLKCLRHTWTWHEPQQVTNPRQTLCSCNCAWVACQANSCHLWSHLRTAILVGQALCRRSQFCAACVNRWRHRTQVNAVSCPPSSICVGWCLSSVAASAVHTCRWRPQMQTGHFGAQHWRKSWQVSRFRTPVCMPAWLPGWLNRGVIARVTRSQSCEFVKVCGPPDFSSCFTTACMCCSTLRCPAAMRSWLWRIGT